MQFFEIGSWLWSVILSVDLARELYTTLTKFSLPRRGGSIFEIKKHLIGYHAFVLGFSTITTILLVPVLKLNGDTGAWCWTNNKQWQLFTYVVLWIGFVVIMASMALINWLVSRAQAALVEREYRGVVSSRTSSRNRRLGSPSAAPHRAHVLLARARHHSAIDVRRMRGTEATRSPTSRVCDPSQGSATSFCSLSSTSRSRRKCEAGGRKHAATCAGAVHKGALFSQLLENSAKPLWKTKATGPTTMEEKKTTIYQRRKDLVLLMRRDEALCSKADCCLFKGRARQGRTTLLCDLQLFNCALRPSAIATTPRYPRTPNATQAPGVLRFGWLPSTAHQPPHVQVKYTSTFYTTHTLFFCAFAFWFQFE